MRNRFDRQLVQLNNELIEMGGMIEKAISDTVKALVNQDIELASNVIEYDEEIDHQEREIELLSYYYSSSRLQRIYDLYQQH